MIISCLIGTLFISGCTTEATNASPTKPPTASGNESPLQTQVSSPFDPRTIKEGTSIAGLTVTKVETSPATPMNKELYVDRAYLDFSGQLEVQGTFRYFPQESEVLGGEILFQVDKNVSFPRMKVSDNDSYARPDQIVLQFQNESEKGNFGSPGSEGKATLILSDFKIRFEQSDIKDTARPLKMIELEDIEPTPQQPDSSENTPGGKEFAELKEYVEKAKNGTASKYEIILASELSKRLAILRLDTKTENWLKEQQAIFSKLVPESVVYFGESKSGIRFVAIAQATKNTQFIYKDAVSKIRKSEDEYDFLLDLAQYTMRTESYFGVDLYAEDETGSLKEIKLDNVYLKEDNEVFPSLPNPHHAQIDKVLSMYNRTLNDDPVIPNRTWKLYLFEGGVLLPQIVVEYNGEQIKLAN